MNWSSWSEFFAMGGYGIYVWGSYLVTLICVMSEVLLISRRHRTLSKTYGLTHDPYGKENSDKEALINTEIDPSNNENQSVKAASSTEEIKK